MTDNQIIPTTPFNLKYLSSIKTDVTTSKAYVLKYFYYTNDGIFLYNVKHRKFVLVHSSKMSNLDMYLPNGIQAKYVDESGQFAKFHARHWLKDEVYDRYEIILKLGAPAIDLEKCAINMMGTLLHDQTKQFKEHSEEAQAGVQAWLDHILNVWCSGYEEQYEFVLDWLSCTGRKKVKCALYLQSLEQTGKSLVIEFLINEVYGPSLGLITSATETINKYTAPMEGCVLVNVNEMPCQSTGEFMQMSNKLKTLITDHDLEVRAMFQQARKSINTFNMILTSNNWGVKTDHTNYRRYKMLDVSNEYSGNFEYFQELCKHKTKAVGAAMLSFLQERYQSKGKYINVDKFPMTNTFKDNYSLDLAYEYIKMEFIKKCKGVNHPLKELYAGYAEYHNEHGTKQIKSEKKFSKTLKDCVVFKHSRKAIKDKGKVLVFKASHGDLHAFFEKHGWIHELDEIEPLNVEGKVVEPDESTSGSDYEEADIEPDITSGSEASDDSVLELLDIGVKKGKNVLTFD